MNAINKPYDKLTVKFDNSFGFEIDDISTNQNISDNSEIMTISVPIQDTATTSEIKQALTAANMKHFIVCGDTKPIADFQNYNNNISISERINKFQQSMIITAAKKKEESEAE